MKTKCDTVADLTALVGLGVAGSQGVGAVPVAAEAPRGHVHLFATPMLGRRWLTPAVCLCDARKHLHACEGKGGTRKRQAVR